MKKLRIAPILLSVFVTAAMPVAAQESDVPYWASIDASKVNMRVGPSQTYPIDWEFTREGLPVKVIRTNQGWRYVEDPDGARGWMRARCFRANAERSLWAKTWRPSGQSQAPHHHCAGMQNPAWWGSWAIAKRAGAKLMWRAAGWIEAEHIWGREGDP